MKKNKNLQNKIDNIIYAIFGKIISKKIKPNYLTIIRFFLIPLIYFLLINEMLALGFFIFIVAASTDFLDGTLARKRNQITDIGKIIDPIADKLLIGTSLIYLGTEYLIIKIFLVIISFEILAVLTSGFLSRFFGRPLGANVFGKIKMILQSVAVAFFLFGRIFDFKIMIILSEVVLVCALVFAIASGIEQSRLKLKEIKTAKI